MMPDDYNKYYIEQLYWKHDHHDSYIGPTELKVTPNGIAIKLENNYKPSKIIENGPATIVIWEDGTKTVVKCQDGDRFDIYSAFCAALAKKIFKTNSNLKRTIADAYVYQKP